MKKAILALCLLFAAAVQWQCKTAGQKAVIDDAAVVHANQEKLTEIIIYDIFSPPVASRIYAYTSLASYEAIRHAAPGYASIAEKLNGFGPMPKPEEGKSYNYTLAAARAFCKVAFNIRIFSDTVLHRYEDSLLAVFKTALPQDVYERSEAYGTAVADAILKRASTDSYKETRGMDKYLGSDADGRWQPTAPDYLDGAEPNWKLIKPFALDTASQFRPLPPIPFSKDSTSAFYQMVKEVYTVNLNLTEEEKTIARYWDDNPAVMQHTGHLMFNNKKITPGGHWMGITAIACKQSAADAVKTAQAYTLTAVALLDAFVSCWDAKYTYEYVRPITLINAWFNHDWSPLLQTPPFPEYTSGHSTITASSAEVLTLLFGDNFAFHDNSDSAYIGMTRDFASFRQAAEEASISRLYGGIHFRPALDTGNTRGAMVGKHLLRKVGLLK